MSIRSTLIATSIFRLIIGIAAVVGGCVMIGLDPSNKQYLFLQGKFIKKEN